MAQRDAPMPFAMLLLRPAFRAPFLDGIYEWPQTKAVFKCAHIAEQLRDCQGAQAKPCTHAFCSSPHTHLQDDS